MPIAYPKIGVLPLFVQDTKKLWIEPVYLGGVMNAGGIPVLLPLSDDDAILEQLCRDLDGFLFTGGQDVDPALYGEAKLPECGYQAHMRDRQEIWMLKRLFKLDKPVLGICRGMQLMPVAAGGTMYQDLPTQKPSEIMHNQIGKAAFTTPTHMVEILPETKLSAAFKTNKIAVNSMHHQAVKDEGENFIVSALAPDGLTEAIEHKYCSFAVGVQWHPEFLWQSYPAAAKVFQMLVDAAKWTHKD